MAEPTKLLDLPVDILVMIFPYLDARSFVSLCQTCKAFQQPDVRLDSTYWSHATRTTFRVPNQPVVQGDGQRWQKLYKRLLTQSRVFTWGNNEKACLGHSFETYEQLSRLPPAMRRRRAMRGRHVSWPTEMENTRGLGIIADMQCGGWSTTLLTSNGALYTVGVIDGLQYIQRRPPYMQVPKVQLVPLRFPAGFPQPTERYDPCVATKEFSSGRSHVLSLCDSGKIWSWSDIERPALQIKLLGVELVEEANKRRRGYVRKVVAGWTKSSALVSGTGIVIWDPVVRGQDDAEDEDTALVLEHASVPRTMYQRPRVNERETDQETQAMGEDVGEVLSYVVLEGFVVFVTDLGKVFAGLITWTAQEQNIPDIVEVPIQTVGSTSVEDSPATDVQGSFHSFAVFKQNGEVLISNEDNLRAHWNMEFDTRAQSDALTFKRIPALQHTGVISVAFGDYHFHALHSNGQISSYGTEPQGCGALGLGGHGDPEGRLRGIRYRGVGGDGQLLAHCYTRGRHVWFEEEKKEWIRFMTSGGHDPEEAKERLRMSINDINTQGEVSEWFEQQGNEWDKHPDLAAADEDGLGAYFALSITAAGWHSGALVLVNEDLADKVKQKCVVVDPSAEEDAESHNKEEPESSSGLPPHPPGAVASTIQWVNNWTRWFLGLPTSADPEAGNLPAGQGYVWNICASTQPPFIRSYYIVPRGWVLATLLPLSILWFARSITKFTSADQLLRYNAPFLYDPRLVNTDFTEPTNHGASPGKGLKYVWANDSFPRLRLSNGTEMPGEIPFSQWKCGRPVWDLDVQV
ncbi:hypothetical protein B0A49_11105 [Cryomyces minteri]|uniref:F-box domain-containing protein n=1 Tax=Cryomyces minteri TaxID=331657 RepID=A0A4U0VTJ9_9PEZI|nr:hypothetical protein B0A49_11105 [Cryomyces minteri]